MKFLFFLFFPLLIFANHLNDLNSQLQKVLDEHSKKTKATALEMSISLPGEYTTRDFVSGYTDKSKKINILSSTLFQIGSITKSFTAALILKLEEEKLLTIDDTIEKTVSVYGLWLPKKMYEAWKKITIKQLLNMTSGIYSYTENEEFLKAPRTGWTLNRILELALSKKADFSPGKGWHYSDTNYIILGLLIEAVTKESLTEQMNKRFLGAAQCNLLNTYYLPGPYPSDIKERMAKGYSSKGIDMSDFDMSLAGAGGAMVSTTIDVVKWIRALFSQQVLSPSLQKKLMTLVSTKDGQNLISDQEQGFGLGVFRVYLPERGGENWVYLGATFGYLAYYAWIPSSNILMSFAANSGIDDQETEKLLQKELPNAIYNLLIAK